MSLFTTFAPTSRATVAYFLAIFVLLGGLASLHNHGDMAAMSDAHWQHWQSKAASARSFAQLEDNAEFSWDMVRIRVNSFNCTLTGSYYSFHLQKNFTGTNVFRDVSAPVL